MNTTDTYVRARIDTQTKQLATHALQAMGLSTSDAIQELELGKVTKTDSLEALMADLNTDD